MDWVLAATMGLQWILWLNGAAGAGKSAIARSVVDLCLEQQIVIARFFFFRTDSTRNTIKPVVSTFAYQLIKLIPALGPIIILSIQSDPLIFNESFETQFKVLVFEPLRNLHQQLPFEKPIVLLADGVDECNGDENQINIVRTIARFISEKSVPLIVIFASRTEAQLKMAFNASEVDTILQRLSLDADDNADNDIQLFLNSSFITIRTTHPFKDIIDRDWPAQKLVQEIVDKSSRQFIYASVVIHFLMSHTPQSRPTTRHCSWAFPPNGSKPFAQLDALYQHIFSQVYDIARVTAILAVAILIKNSNISRICKWLDITKEDVKVALEDLTSTCVT